MPPIVTFIGWHDSGKTTLASQVVRHLKQLAYQVAVIKSTKETGIVFDTPGSDTHTHRSAGADAVMLVAPDQMVIMTENRDESLSSIASRYFPEVDIVIAEGFKNDLNVSKIEVFRNSETGELLRNSVRGVVAVASDKALGGEHIFRLNEADKIASFIEKRFIQDGTQGRSHTSLLVNGKTIPMMTFIQETLAGTICGFVDSLKLDGNPPTSIDIRITLPKNKTQ